MTILALAHLVASLGSFIAFLVSVWEHDINMFALATSSYALGSFFEEIIKTQ